MYMCIYTYRWGVALCALGMLSNLPCALTIDAYGPVCDNAGGIAEVTLTPNPLISNRTTILRYTGCWREQHTHALPDQLSLTCTTAARYSPQSHPQMAELPKEVREKTDILDAVSGWGYYICMTECCCPTLLLCKFIALCLKLGWIWS